jgi:hypothetical protein
MAPVIATPPLKFRVETGEKPSGQFLGLIVMSH